MAKVPFSDDTAILVLDKLKDPEFVQELVDELRKVFKVSYIIVTVARELPLNWNYSGSVGCQLLTTK